MQMDQLGRARRGFLRTSSTDNRLGKFLTKIMTDLYQQLLAHSYDQHGQSNQ